jgi:hypothetical protein
MLFSILQPLCVQGLNFVGQSRFARPVQLAPDAVVVWVQCNTITHGATPLHLPHQAYLQVLLEEICVPLAVAVVEILDTLHVCVASGFKELSILRAHTRDDSQALDRFLHVQVHHTSYRPAPPTNC